MAYYFADAFAAYEKAKAYDRAAAVLAKMKNAGPESYKPYALSAMLMILRENAKPQKGRSYAAACAEYQQARQRVTSSDDTTQPQQLEGLIQQRKSGSWL